MDDARQWAEEQWSACDPGDRRRTRRAVALGVRMAGHSDRSLPRQMAGMADLKAACRLLDSEGDARGAHGAPPRPGSASRRLVRGSRPVRPGSDLSRFQRPSGDRRAWTDRQRRTGERFHPRLQRPDLSGGSGAAGWPTDHRSGGTHRPNARRHPQRHGNQGAAPEAGYWVGPLVRDASGHRTPAGESAPDQRRRQRHLSVLPPGGRCRMARPVAALPVIEDLEAPGIAAVPPAQP
jgi:hypothetical protein